MKTPTPENSDPPETFPEFDLDPQVVISRGDRRTCASGTFTTFPSMFSILSFKLVSSARGTTSAISSLAEAGPLPVAITATASQAIRCRALTMTQTLARRRGNKR